MEFKASNTKGQLVNLGIGIICRRMDGSHGTNKEVIKKEINHNYHINQSNYLLEMWSHDHCVNQEQPNMVGSKYEYIFWDQIQLGQIRYIAFSDLNTDSNYHNYTAIFYSNMIQVHWHVLNLIQIHGPCFHYGSSGSQWVDFLSLA